MRGKPEKEIFSQQCEIDTVTIVNTIQERAVKSNWKPGVPSMTREDDLAVVERLRREHVSKMVAAARE